MFKNLFGKKDTPQSASYSEAILFAIDKFIEDFDEWYNRGEVDEESADDFLYNQIFEHVRNEELTNQLYVFIPVALTRIWFEQQPIKLSETYSKSREGSDSQLVWLDSIEVYRQIVTVLRSKLSGLSDEDAYKILAHSSEYKIIGYALEQGVPLENVKMAPFVSGV
ncbi:hypothetical protein ACAW74_24370 [Fibrella sp. WM1]|uniref:hypothetical protein n=1 Tax=Fibrella musci TaxID=3242485 RepID=UPI0035203F79